MWKALKYAVTVLALGVLLSYPIKKAKAFQPGDHMWASVICYKLNEIHTFVDLLNQGENQAAYNYVTQDPTINCYLYTQMGLPYFPVTIEKKIEERKKRIIYSATIEWPNGESNKVYVFELVEGEAI